MTGRSVVCVGHHTDYFSLLFTLYLTYGALHDDARERYMTNSYIKYVGIHH